ncbi:MAG: hypothetical protein J7639_33635, partial [Paenibacillaceae bacterium]|nr:hypothetical protein [Paenibacillaceae bacterium]
MKRSWKGTIAGLTAPLLLALPLAACSSSGKSDPKAADSPKPSASAQTTAQPSATPAKAEEPIELTWLSFNPPEADGSWVELYLDC